jgi:cysteine-rich repeat protein
MISSLKTVKFALTIAMATTVVGGAGPLQLADCFGGGGGDDPVCGNGIIEENELCDDGNTVTERRCEYGTAECTLCNESCSETIELTGPFCGDGTVQRDEEECDGSEFCTSQCIIEGPNPGCGNGVIEGDEECDDGNLNSNAYSLDGFCKTDCSGIAPYCGDGVLHYSEYCDSGELNSDFWSSEEHCNLDCTDIGPYCGDGIVHEGRDLGCTWLGFPPARE